MEGSTKNRKRRNVTRAISQMFDFAAQFRQKKVYDSLSCSTGAAAELLSFLFYFPPPSLLSSPALKTFKGLA